MGSFPKLGVKPHRFVVTEANVKHPFEENTALPGKTPIHGTWDSTDEPLSAPQAKALLWEDVSADERNTRRAHSGFHSGFAGGSWQLECC